jgi:hypothetical protein
VFFNERLLNALASSCHCAVSPVIVAADRPAAGVCPLPPAIHDLWQLMPGFCKPPS